MPADLRKTVVATSPVTLAEAKAHLRVTVSAEDDLIASKLATAIADAELECGRGFGVSTWKMVLDSFEPFSFLANHQSTPDLYLPILPVASIVAVRYYDIDGVQQTMSASGYWLAGRTGRIAAKTSWPELEPGRPESVEIEFTAGEATIPHQARDAVLLILGARYVHRGDGIPTADPTGAAEIPPAARRLLRQLWSGVL